VIEPSLIDCLGGRFVLRFRQIDATDFSADMLAERHDFYEIAGNDIHVFSGVSWLLQALFPQNTGLLPTRASLASA
jgi:hypothetical protein